MFNRTLNRIAGKVQKNLFNPDQALAPQPWHVPEENIFRITDTPDLNRAPRVVFTPGALENETVVPMQAFNVQPEQKTWSQQINPADFAFSRTYTLEKIPVKPILDVRVLFSGGDRLTLTETDDFTVDYTSGSITFREHVDDVTAIDIHYRTGETAGPAGNLHMTQYFYIEVTAENAGNAEAIAAIIMGVIEASKEYILANSGKTYNGLNVITTLTPIDIQPVNRAENFISVPGTSVTLVYRVPGSIRIFQKTPGDTPSLIEKIYHPGVVASEHDVAVRVDTP